ncbi:hypothetical protein BDZ97DRAFT_124218 [Flammula alnicola]|nr:hypothetical protein BDZ97DRAFT_124218 [Flammula alnicola]
MLIMRMYALYERSRRILALHIGVALTVVGIGCWAVLGGKSQEPPDLLVPIGCASSLTHDQAIRMGAAWAGMLFFDSLVFGMTLYKSLSLPRITGTNLLTVLLRDGTIYFAVMMASNLANILTFLFGGPLTRGVATTFTNVISSIMISRLMLNLRDPSLVPGSGRKRSSYLTTENLTYPNLTFVVPQYSTQYSDAGGIMPPPGRARAVYHYLATGSSRKNDSDIELVTLQNSHV